MQDCALMQSSELWSGDVNSERWQDYWCYASTQCLCELGADAAPAYLAFIEADIEKGLHRAWEDFHRWIGVVLVLWALPPLILLARRLMHSVRARRAHAAPVGLESLNRARPADLKEAFNIRRTRSTSSLLAALDESLR